MFSDSPTPAWQSNKAHLKRINNEEWLNKKERATLCRFSWLHSIRYLFCLIRILLPHKLRSKKKRIITIITLVHNPGIRCAASHFGNTGDSAIRVLKLGLNLSKLPLFIWTFCYWRAEKKNNSPKTWRFILLDEQTLLQHLIIKRAVSFVLCPPFSLASPCIALPYSSGFPDHLFSLRLDSVSLYQLGPKITLVKRSLKSSWRRHSNSGEGRLNWLQIYLWSALLTKLCIGPFSQYWAYSVGRIHHRTAFESY